MMYGSLFPNASDSELASLRQMAARWKKYEQEVRRGCLHVPIRS